MNAGSRNPLDAANVVLEIRASTDGDDAARLVVSLFNEYTAIAEEHDWHLKVLNLIGPDDPGCKEIIVGMAGTGVYGKMRWKGNQVCAKEKQDGTGYVTVSMEVLPEPDDSELVIDPKTLRYVYFSNGLVRITHLPTGIRAKSHEDSLIVYNEANALRILRARVYARARPEQNETTTKSK